MDESLVDESFVDEPFMDKTLAAHHLLADPRINEAKRLLRAAVSDHQHVLGGVKPPDPERRVAYEELLASFAKWRGANLWFPYIGSGFGRGALVELLDGSVKYDLISGIGPHYLGHSHPDLLSAGIDAALSDLVIQGNLQQNGDVVELTELLIRASGMDHLFLTSSGAMANENALKIAFQKRWPAQRILAFDHCFAGRSLVLSQITDKPAFREDLPLFADVDYIPFYDPNAPEASTDRAAAALRESIARYPKQHALMLFELVQGEGGFYPGSREFFTTLMAICKEHGILVLDDEVQCFGRLPELFAYHYFGLDAWVDIVTIGKLAHVCATLYRKESRPRPGLLSQTFIASTSAIRAALAILNELQHGNYYGPNGKIVHIHNRFAGRLEEIATRYPELIRGPFGIGCMIAFTPYDGSYERIQRFVQELFQAGVISFIAGSNPTRVRLLPPAAAMSDDVIDHVIKIIEQTLVAGAPCS